MKNTVIVVGASRGFGAATATALAAGGNSVLGIARNWSGSSVGGDVVRVEGDGRDAALAKALLDEHQPTAVVVGGGVAPHMAPLEDQTFETLSRHWEADVAIAFTWLQAVLKQRTTRPNTVAVLSSGAGMFGSPGSGGYAGAKATTRFLTASAADSAARLEMATRFVSVNPKLTSATDLGRIAVSGYAEIGGQEPGELPAPIYSAEHAGALLADLVTNPATYPASTYILAEDELKPM